MPQGRGTAVSRGRLGRVRPAVWLWALLLGSHVGYVLLRTTADEVLPVRTDYAIALERAISFGAVPTVALQQRLYDGLPLAAWEWAAVVVYFSFFLAPFALAGLLTAVAPRTLRVFAIAMAAAYALSLAGHFLLPTVPPWLAAYEGALPPVRRIVHELLYGAELYARGLRVSDNDVAAMPSFHLASTAVVAFAIVRLHARAAPAAWAYIAAMAFALVYLGEHYLVDAVAGLLVGVLAWRIALRATPAPAAAPGAAAPLQAAPADLRAAP